MSTENGPPSDRKQAANEKRRRQESLDDPNGVRYIDQLWDLIKDKDEPLTVVLRTKDQLFVDITARVWWIRRKPYSWESDVERHQLVFDVPDKVWRRVQTQFVSEFVHNLLGIDLPVLLPKARRTDTDDERRVEVMKTDEHSKVVEIAGTDWPKLRKAIERTAACSINGMGGDDVKLHGNIPARARVVGSQIQVYIGKQVVAQILANLQCDFKGHWAIKSP